MKGMAYQGNRRAGKALFYIKKVERRMLMSTEAILQIIAYVISAILTGSTILYRIQQLEKKVEKHNCLVERMAIVEQSTKSAHHRLDEIVKKVN